MPNSPFIATVGSKRQVFQGRAKHTSGGLVKSDLKRSSSSGKIVSKKASAAAKKNHNLGSHEGDISSLRK